MGDGAAAVADTIELESMGATRKSYQKKALLGGLWGVPLSYTKFPKLTIIKNFIFHWLQNKLLYKIQSSPLLCLASRRTTGSIPAEAGRFGLMFLTLQSNFAE